MEDGGYHIVASKVETMATAPPPPAPPVPLSRPVAVIDPKYCVDYNVDLTVTHKVLSLKDRDYAIKDINDKVVFRVHGKLLCLRGRRTLTDANGDTVLTMREKLLSMHERWQVFRGKSTDTKDLLFSVKKSSLIQLDPQLDVFLASNTRQRVCDFKVKGSRRSRSVTIFLGDTKGIISRMKKQSQLKSVIIGQDVFHVTVYPMVDYAFVAALVVLLDDIGSKSEK